MRTPICALLVAATLSATATAGGCGGEPVARVRVLQVDPAAFAARNAPAASRLPPTRVSATLTEAAAPVPPPVHVPQVGSVAVGAPDRGSLVNGLQLPESGPDWLTWDAVLQRSPNRPERRWGTDRLLA